MLICGEVTTPLLFSDTKAHYFWSTLRYFHVLLCTDFKVRADTGYSLSHRQLLQIYNAKEENCGLNRVPHRFLGSNGRDQAP
jgi:hypothetical protein